MFFLFSRSWRAAPLLAGSVLLSVSFVPLPARDASAEPADRSWTPLFDHTTTSLSGFHLYNRAGEAPSRWSAEKGVLHLRARDGGTDHQDLVITPKPLRGFELEFDWKISPGGNSGVFYKTVEDSRYEKPWFTGLEYQLLDNQRATDNKLPNHLAASIYDLVAPPADFTLPVGEWNHSRIVVHGHHIEHWLNGRLTASIELSSPEWQHRVEKSKYADKPDFAKAPRGVVILQDHGDELWFREIRILRSSRSHH